MCPGAKADRTGQVYLLAFLDIVSGICCQITEI